MTALDAQYRELDTRLSDLRALEGSAGWRLYLSELKAALRVSRMEIFAMETNSFDSVIAMATKTAKIAGIQYAIILVEGMIMDAEMDFETITTALEEEKRDDGN